MKTIRKFLCVAITLIMLVGLFPLSALASGEEALPEEQSEAAEPVEQEQPEVVETPAPADEPEQPETTPPRI